MDPLLTRRTALKLGLTGLTLAACPLVGQRRAWAAGADPHLLITFHADGGWDPVQVLDPHDPTDATDGIDVDVPQVISNLPPSQLATAGGLTYVSNPTTRPNVDAYFAAWGARTAIVNGVNTRSTSHDQSTQLMHTGYLDPTRADFAVMAAHHLGPDLPLPHLLLSGPSFGGQFAGLSGRVGGQLTQALSYNRMTSGQLAVSTAGETAIKAALDQMAALDAAAPDALAARFGEFTEAQARGDRFAALARSLPSDGSDAATLATGLGNAFRQGLTTSVSIAGMGGFDTHTDNLQQNDRWNRLFGSLKTLVDALAAQPGLVAPSLLDETTIVYVSDFGRTPELNGDNGKDHHPWTSVLLIGKGVRTGTFGLTDRTDEGVAVDFATGQPSDGGSTIDVTNLIAGLLTLVGANPDQYLPSGVRPFTAMIAA